jgi:hypothetical protein
MPGHVAIVFQVKAKRSNLLTGPMGFSVAPSRKALMVQVPFRPIPSSLLPLVRLFPISVGLDSNRFWSILTLFLQSVRTFPSLLESHFLLARIADQIIHLKAPLGLEVLVRFERLFSLDRRSKAAPALQIPKLLRATGSRRSDTAFALFLHGLEPH